MTLKLLKIVPSKNSKKKYDAVFEVDGKERRVGFGASGYEDYTIHRDEKRLENYRKRHQHDRLSSPMSPGALSWYILWNKPTLQASIQDYKKRFGL